jgi:hypothetical protein
MRNLARADEEVFAHWVARWWRVQGLLGAEAALAIVWRE